MKTYLFPALKLTFLCIILFVVVYPSLIWAVAQLSENQGKGDLQNVGQAFTQDKYFQTRPSAVSYNGGGSGGSNKGIANADYLKEVQARIDTFLVHNPDIQKAAIPSDLVTASGSGLDPHISPQAALVQVKRIAKIRKIDEQKLIELVNQHIEKPLFGLFGTAKVHVLKLNLALDKM
ncbi:MAG: potassium-transporting ATPase subunit C [Cytophagales bacterium]|nr:MAG: potassium-transporting ATPase subunit C [Cytophagales bacterium]